VDILLSTMLSESLRLMSIVKATSEHHSFKKKHIYEKFRNEMHRYDILVTDF